MRSWTASGKGYTAARERGENRGRRGFSCPARSTAAPWRNSSAPPRGHPFSLRSCTPRVVPAAKPAADGPIRLNANENPDGPCAASLAALSGCAGVAARYPFAKQEETQAVIARHHGVKPEQIVLGAGSSDVLRMADSAFLGPGKTIVAAEPTFEAVLQYARSRKPSRSRSRRPPTSGTICPPWLRHATRARDSSTSATRTTRPGRSSGRASSKRSSTRSRPRPSCSWTRRTTTSSTDPTLQERARAGPAARQRRRRPDVLEDLRHGRHAPRLRRGIRPRTSRPWSAARRGTTRARRPWRWGSRRWPIPASCRARRSA